MKMLLLFLALIFNLSLLHSFEDDELPPDGYEWGVLTDEDFEDWEDGGDPDEEWDFVRNFPDDDDDDDIDKDALFAKSKHHLSEKDEINYAANILIAMPNAVVANCVNAITGSYFESEIDLVTLGPQPIVVQRSYCSSEKKWHFRHLPELKIGVSGGKHHLIANYADDCGSGMYYRGHLRKNEVTHHSLLIPESVFKSGLTNCCGEEISGQTNWKNSNLRFVQTPKEKIYVLRHGTHVDRFFVRYKRDDKKHKKGPSTGKFQLIKERHPNGNFLEYCYGKNSSLYKVSASNRDGTIIGKLFLNYGKDGMRWLSDSGEAVYYLEGSLLKKSQPSHGPEVQYQYDMYNRVRNKKLPDNRNLGIDYYVSGDSKNRVHHLYAPVGDSLNSIATHTFEYKLDNSTSTSVRDAHGILTKYHYGKDSKRITRVESFVEGDNSYSTDDFCWDHSQLVKREFKGDGKTYFIRCLEYDPFGNITHDRLTGNLTGKSDNETYVKTFAASQDGWNLPIYEDDGRKQTTYTYYPNSNLLKERFTKSLETVLKREFFEYDVNGILIREIWDDGIGFAQDDLTGISERHLKKIRPNALGLPEQIEELYYDKTTQNYALLKKTIQNYSLQGKMLQQEHYGSDNQLAYTLFWEYDAFGNITRHIDAIGNATTYKYDKNGNKIYEQGPKGDFYKTYAYDFANRLIKEEEVWDDQTHFITQHRYNKLNQRIATIDHFGNEKNYHYDAIGRLIKTVLPAVLDPSGNINRSEIKHCYNAMGCLIASHDANNNCIQKEFNIRGQPTRIQYPDGSIEFKEYTLDGLLACEVAKNGVCTTYSHDALGRVIHTEVRDAQHQLLKTTSSSYNSFRLLSETDAAGLITTYEYDHAGRKIAMKKGNQLTKYVYDTLGNISELWEAIDESSFRITEKHYDFLGRIVSETIRNEQGKIFKKETYRYDPVGNRTHVIMHTKIGSIEKQTEYNSHNKPKVITNAQGQTTSFFYNYRALYGQMLVEEVTSTDALNNVEIITYDYEANVKSVQRRDCNGNITQWEKHFYDPECRRVLTESIIYSPLKEPYSVFTKWEYDSMDRVTSVIEGYGTPEQKIIRTNYNKNGLKESILKPDGVVIKYEHDLLNRLINVFSSDGSIHNTYSYTLWGDIAKAHDLINNTTTIRIYNSECCLKSETLGNGQTISYEYNRLHQPKKITLPDQTSISYQYDAAGVTCVERNNGCHTYAHQYLNYDFCFVYCEELAGNAGKVNRQYDKRGRLTSLQTKHWNLFIPQKGYDPIGNLLCRSVTDGEGNYDYCYAYDSLYQLILENEHKYQNDSHYNRVSKDSEIYELNSLNQCVDDKIEYDLNGNLIRKGNIKYRYDALDRLIETNNGTAVTYLYDPFNRRIAKTEKNQTTHYLYQDEEEFGALQNNVVTELRIDGNSGNNIGSTVAIELKGVPYAVVNDPFGNIVAVVDLQGKLVEWYRYTAFGETQTFGKRINNPWRYSGKRFDSETGFYYFGQRYYDPEMGRWITPDPAGFVDGLNLYEYVYNNPFCYVDPNGEFAFLIPIAISMAANYCLPYATACLSQYAGGAIAAGVLTGIVQGYDGDYAPSSTGEFWTSASINVGKGIGAALAFSNTAKTTYNAGKNLFSTIGQKEVGSALLNRASSVTRSVSTSGTTQKVIQSAERFAVKDGMNSNSFVNRGASFAGSKRQPLDYAPFQKIRNPPAIINGRKFSGHALDRMQDRGFVPSVIENAIKTGRMSPNKVIGRLNYYDDVNKVNVIMENEQIISIIPGRRK